jgi:hypothetical protein
MKNAQPGSIGESPKQQIDAMDGGGFHIRLGKYIQTRLCRQAGLARKQATTPLGEAMPVAGPVTAQVIDHPSHFAMGGPALTPIAW